jgi:outer membrane protein TolC
MAVALPAAAQTTTTTDAHIQELIRAAAASIGAAQAVAAPGTEPSQTAPGTVVPLSLEDAVKFALDRNLDIAVQRLNPQISDISVASARSVYHPTLTSVVGPQSNTQLPTNQVNLGTNNAAPVTDTLTYNGGVAQSIPWGGGAFSAALNNFRRKSTSNNTTYNPLFQSNWSFAYVQPLLRNFALDSTRQQLQVTRINRDISDVQLRATIVNTVSNVRNAYWDYVFATQAVEVARQSMDLATKLVQDNQTRVEVGTMAPIDVVQAQSEQATRRQTLVQAEATRRTTELALKRLIVNGTQDPLWNAAVDPVDRPEFRPEPIDIVAAVRQALSQRTDLEIAKKNMESNDVTYKLLRDQLKPQADLSINYGLQGLGGTQLVRTNSGVLGSAVTNTIPGGLTDTFSSLFRNSYPTWSAQVTFAYPLGLSTQEANAARARVQLNQIQAQLKQIELQVATDVTNAAIQAQTTSESVQAAQAARELGEKKLEAEQSKFEVGMSTNYFVVQAQRDLRDAQNSELRAILNYRKSLVELERLQQTTLSNLGITIISGAGGGAVGGTATTRANNSGS